MRSVSFMTTRILLKRFSRVAYIVILAAKAFHSTLQIHNYIFQCPGYPSLDFKMNNDVDISHLTKPSRFHV